VRGSQTQQARPREPGTQCLFHRECHQERGIPGRGLQSHLGGGRKHRKDLSSDQRLAASWLEACQFQTVTVCRARAVEATAEEAERKRTLRGCFLSLLGMETDVFPTLVESKPYARGTACGEETLGNEDERERGSGEQSTFFLSLCVNDRKCTY